MKSCLEDKDVESIDYPKLMISTTKDVIIVLMTKERSGMVVFTKDNSYPVGYYSEEWFEICFDDYNGKVILEN